MGPCQARLESLGDLLQIVVGTFSEASTDLDRTIRGIAESRPGALPLKTGGAASHRSLDWPSTWPALEIFLCPLFPVPGGLSGVPSGASWGGRQGGGGQEEGLDSPGDEDPEGGRGLSLRLHQGTGEGPGPPWT